MRSYGERESASGAREADATAVHLVGPGNAAVARILHRYAGSQGAGPLDPGIGAAIESERGGGVPLPDGVRATMEGHFGTDLSAVRVHTGPRADELNQAVQARAFTTGADIFFSRGNEPGASGPSELLAHELTHVLQQRAGSGGSRVSHPDEPEEVQARATAAEVMRRQAGDPVRAVLSRIPPDAGNSAITRLVRRDPIDAGPPKQSPGREDARGVIQRQPEPGPAPPGLPPDQQAQLLQATTTLHEVQPLGDADAATLQQAIPGTALYQMIGRRDQKRAELADRTAQLTQMRDQQAHPPENGAPPNDLMVNEVADQVTTLTDEVARLDHLVHDGLAPLGLNSEAELTDLVDNRFPTLFLNRAKQIALTQLEDNRKIVDAEVQRYGLNACVDPAARQALVAAAQDLVAHDHQLDELHHQMDLARSDVDLPSGGVPDPSRMSSSYHDMMALQERYDQASAEREQLRGRYAMQHPILLKTGIDLNAIASGDPAQFDAVVGGQLRQTSENIDTTRDNINSGRLKVWNLNNIVQITNQDLGTTNNEVLQAAVQRHIRAEQMDEAIVNTAVAALAITAGIIATLASGGLAAGAAVVALAAGGYQASESVRNYLAQGAAMNVALDPAVANLTREEPGLGWVLLDIISVGLDVAQVVSAFRAVSAAARAVEETGDVLEFANQARRAVPGPAAEKLIASASRRARNSGSVQKVLEALKDSTAFHPDALAAVEKQLGTISKNGWDRVFARLSGEGRVHPLTEEAITHVYGAEQAKAITANSPVDASLGGLYVAVEGSPGQGHLFLAPGHLDEVASTAVHETTHYLQDLNSLQLDTFRKEYQAWLAQRAYLRELERAGGEISTDMRAILEAEDAMLADTICSKYKLDFASTYDASKEMANVMAMLKRFP